MKHMILISLILTVANAASAVTTKNCPQEIRLGYKSVTVMTKAQLGKELEYNHMDEEEAVDALQALRDIRGPDYDELTYFLEEKVNAQCRYAPLGQELQSENETRLITRNGRDILRVSLSVGRENFWIYHDVSEMSPTSLKVSKTSGKVLGVMNHGGPGTGLGWANDITITVEK